MKYIISAFLPLFLILTSLLGQQATAASTDTGIIANKYPVISHNSSIDWEIQEFPATPSTDLVLQLAERLFSFAGASLTTLKKIGATTVQYMPTQLLIQVGASHFFHLGRIVSLVALGLNYKHLQNSPLSKAALWAIAGTRIFMTISGT